MGLRDKILGANDLPLEAVEVSEWGCTVYVRPLNGHQRNKLVKDALAGGVLYGSALVPSLCDKDGIPLFSELDVDVLNTKSGKVLERLSALVVKLNGLNSDALEDEKKS